MTAFRIYSVYMNRFGALFMRQTCSFIHMCCREQGSSLYWKHVNGVFRLNKRYWCHFHLSLVCGTFYCFLCLVLEERLKRATALLLSCVSDEFFSVQCFALHESRIYFFLFEWCKSRISWLALSFSSMWGSGPCIMPHIHIQHIRICSLSLSSWLTHKINTLWVSIKCCERLNQIWESKFPWKFVLRPCVPKDIDLAVPHFYATSNKKKKKKGEICPA